MAFPIKRCEVWKVDLKPQTHSEEPAKECLVIQADEINAIHQTVIVTPISSSAEATYPNDEPVHPPIIHGRSSTASAPFPRDASRGRERSIAALSLR